MPATITPNRTEPDRKRRVEDHDNGSGRRPPTDKRTGGGGDNDNWNDRPQGSRGPREKLKRYRLGVFFALAGDLMFFVAIVSAFFVTKHSGHFDAYNHWIVSWMPIAIPKILWRNTVILLASSITIEIARRSIFREIDVMEEWLGLGTPTRKRVLPWLAISIALGMAFLWGQYIAWQQLAQQRIYSTNNPSSKFFYLITGIHGIHLLVGILLLATAVVGMRAIRTIESRQILVDCAAWYWHSMGILWLFLFGLLVYGQ
jgi:cytochrome c oxidase subunit III